MTTSIEIFSKVNDYLDKRISLWELESWLVSMLNIYLSNPNSKAAELVGVIELGLAEINANIRTERSFRAALKKNQFSYEPIKSVTYPELDEQTFAYTNGETSESTNSEWIDPILSWNREPQVEYV